SSESGSGRSILRAADDDGRKGAPPHHLREEPDRRPVRGLPGSREQREELLGEIGEIELARFDREPWRECFAFTHSKSRDKSAREREVTLDGVRFGGRRNGERLAVSERRELARVLRAEDSPREEPRDESAPREALEIDRRVVALDASKELEARTK